MKATAALLHQRMRAEGDGTFVPPDDPPTIGIESIENTAVEGDEVFFRIFQVSGLINISATVIVTFTSTAGVADLVAPTVETIVLNSGDVEEIVSVVTVNRSGTQGNRDLRATLTVPSGGDEETLIDPTRSFAITVLQDVFVPPAVIGAFAQSPTTIVEASSVTAQIRRVSGDPTATVNINWAWTSSLDATDFAVGAVLTGVATLNASISQVNISVATAARSGTQGSRGLFLTLTGITNGVISPTNSSAAFQLDDFVVTLTPTVGIFANSGSDIVEGNNIGWTLRRLVGSGTQAVTVNYSVISNLSTSSDLVAPTTGTLTLPASATTVGLTSGTNNRTGLQGNRTITITINSPSIGNINQATANATLIDVAEDPDPPPTTEFPKHLPTVSVSKWHCVGFNQTGSKATYAAGRAGLDAAMNSSNLAPGDLIVLDNGTYSGSAISTSRAGTHTASGSQRIMMRSRTHLGATISLQVRINGVNWWMSGIRFTFRASGGYESSSTAIVCTRSGLWVTNSSIPNGLFVTIAYPGGTPYSNFNFCYNSIGANPDEGAVITASIALVPMGSGSNLPSNSNIAWCTFNRPSGGVHNFLYAQKSKPSSNSVAVQQSFRFAYNIVEGDGRLYTKRNMTYEYNFIDSTLTGPIVFRDGQIENNNYDTGGIIRGNRFGNGGNIELNGSGITIIGNRCDSGTMVAALNCGQVPKSANGGEHEAADYCTLVDNPGFDIIIGDVQSADNHTVVASKGGNPNNVRIYKGNRGWNPNLDFTSNGHTTPPSAVVVNTGGLGGYPAINTIVESVLRAGAGCDPA